MTILKETEEYIYLQFEKLCDSGDESELELFIQTFNVDVNKDNGYYIELICARNDISLLQMFIKRGADIHINNEGALRMSAHMGSLNVLTYLIEKCNANYEVLYDSTAYSNKLIVKQYLDEYNATNKISETNV